MKLFRRLYDWVMHWADTPYGTPALGVLAFAESSFFPVPPDPLLMAFSLSKPKRALFYAAVCSVCSVVGGLLGYFIGYGLWNVVGDFFFNYLGPMGFTPENFAAVQSKYEANAFLAIFAAGFTPIPYKVFTVAAGVFSISLRAVLPCLGPQPICSLLHSGRSHLPFRPFHQAANRQILQLADDSLFRTSPRGLFSCKVCDVIPQVGAWLSLVEHLVRDQGVVGSNPIAPTI